MKKLIAILLAAAVLFLLSSCNKSTDNTESTEPHTVLAEEESEPQSISAAIAETAENITEKTTKSDT